MTGILFKIDRIIDRGAAGILVVFVLAMLILTLIAIVGRWIGHTALWVEPLVRHLVFFAAFLGGVLATGKGNHIAIDLVGKLLEKEGRESAKKIVDLMVNGFCLLVVIWLTSAGITFFHQEQEFGKEVFLGIHSGTLVASIPIGFSLMGFRFLVNIVGTLTGRKEPLSQDEIPTLIVPPPGEN